MSEDRKTFEKMLNAIAGCERIVIYGAGRYGQLLLKQLYSWEIYKKGWFAETFPSAQEELMGWEIRNISDFARCDEKTVVIVAVGVKLMEEMVSNLQRLEIKNYVVLSDEMRCALREWENSKMPDKKHDLEMERMRESVSRMQEDIRRLEKEIQEFPTRVEAIIASMVHKMEQSWKITEHQQAYITEKVSGIVTESENPLVSVLVPIYNVQSYLRQCLDSLCGQSFKDFEVICINDGSTDGSLEIIKEYMEKDSRFRVISKVNTGYGDSMNQGLKAAKGDYIVILESDDFAVYDMLQRLSAAILAYDADVAVANYYMYHHEEKQEELIEVLGKLPYGQILTKEEQSILACATPSIWKGIYRKEFLFSKEVDFLPTPGASYQDASFAFKAYMAADKVVALKEPVLYYRRGHETASVKDTSKVFCICDEFAAIKEYIAKKKCVDWYPAYAQSLMDRYYWNYNRLSGEAKEEFMKKFVLDMKECIANGWISEERVRLRDRRLLG